MPAGSPSSAVMASALFTGSVVAAVRGSLLRRCCSTAAAASAPVPASADAQDIANVQLRGTVERLLSAGPKVCFFALRTRVSNPRRSTPVSFSHLVKAFGDATEGANAAARVGSRVHVDGVLTYERRNMEEPSGKENPFRCVIRATSVRAEH